MSMPTPIWWEEIQKYISYDDITFDEIISNDCPKELLNIYLEWKIELEGICNDALQNGINL